MFPWQSMPIKAFSHPYYPQAAVVTGYAPNRQDVTMLVLYLATGLAGFLGVTTLGIRARYPKLSTMGLALALWFTFSGFIHVALEGYSALNHARIAGAQDVLGQLWKEYAKADSRYVTQDALPFSIDGLTAAVLGPLCFYAAYLVAEDAPASHAVQLLVSACQLWGNAIYLGTAEFERLVHARALSRPEPLYYWVYFVACNGIWLVVPLACIVNSALAVTRMAQQSQNAQRSSDGLVKAGRKK